MSSMVLASFLAFLLVTLAIGLLSMRRSRGTPADYYLASRRVHPMLAGLSAVATNNSGYMFIGVIGFTHTVGLAAVWLMVGWIVGDFLASLFVHRELRLAAERHTELTFAGVLSRWSGREHRAVRVLAAVLTVIFLGAYSAAQLSAGGKALQVLLGWDLASGAIMVAIIVAAYCLAGGIRASIWTDVAQSAVMLAAMTVLCVAAVNGLGGVSGSFGRLDEIPGFLDWFPPDLIIPGAAGMALFVVGWMFAGLSVIGQPHIMVRFMALDAPRSLWQARCWYYGFFTVFYALATVVGLLSRVYLPDLHGMDPELALPRMAQTLLPPALIGLTLAGIFAATMSTADSLVLSYSAALTQDLAPRRARASLLACKVATLAVTLLALGIALAGPRSVFTLVILAWSTLASAFAPLLIVYALRQRPSQTLALVMMIIGPCVALWWRALGLHEQIYEGLPGIIAGLLVYGIGSRIAGLIASLRPASVMASSGAKDRAAVDSQS